MAWMLWKADMLSRVRAGGRERDQSSDIRRSRRRQRPPGHRFSGTRWKTKEAMLRASTAPRMPPPPDTNIVTYCRPLFLPSLGPNGILYASYLLASSFFLDCRGFTLSKSAIIVRDEFLFAMILQIYGVLVCQPMSGAQNYFRLSNAVVDCQCLPKISYHCPGIPGI